MAGPWDLTGQNIENTYQRVLQTPDGTTFYDGTGSLVTLPSANTASLLTTASAAGNTITFTKGDGSTFPVTVTGGTGTPGGSNTQIQFNSASVFSGSSNLSFDYTTNNFFITGSIISTGSNYFTGNQYITGSIYIPDNNYSIYFSGSGAASRLVWNDTDGTLDLGLKGGAVTLQVGQENVIRVVNKTGADLLESEYKVVRIRRKDEGGAQGQRLAVVLSQANNDPNSVDTLGLVTENIIKNEEGFITTFGVVHNIDTQGTLQGETWNEGDVLYLSPYTAGLLTNIKPQAPNHTIIVGFVIYKHPTLGKIFVKVDNGYELDELHNVRINTASLSYGDLLMYDSNVWYNTKTLSGSYDVSGSFHIINSTSTTSSLSIISGSTKVFTVTGSGVTVFEPYNYVPQAVAGGIYFNGTDFFLGY